MSHEKEELHRTIILFDVLLMGLLPLVGTIIGYVSLVRYQSFVPPSTGELASMLIIFGFLPAEILALFVLGTFGLLLTLVNVLILVVGVLAWFESYPAKVFLVLFSSVVAMYELLALVYTILLSLPGGLSSTFGIILLFRIGFTIAIVWLNVWYITEESKKIKA